VHSLSAFRGLTGYFLLLNYDIKGPRGEEDTVKARRLIESSTFEPETLQIIFKGFDEAWSEISHQFDDTGDTTVEQARLRLAHAVLVVAREGSDDP